jgi:hypothetical protein
MYAAAFGAFAVWFLRNRGAGADPAEGMALAEAARVLHYARKLTISTPIFPDTAIHHSVLDFRLERSAMDHDRR